MTIRKILNGKLVELKLSEEVVPCIDCVFNGRTCRTEDKTCLEDGNSNKGWQLVEENPLSTEVGGHKYVGTLKDYREQCDDCAAYQDQALCGALKKLNLCDNRYWIKAENKNTEEGQ